MLHRYAVISLLAVLCSASVFAAATQGGSIPVPLPLFPPNNWWNTDITSAPVDTNSASYITFIINGRSDLAPLHPDFGGNAGPGYVYGFPFIVVDGTQTKLAVMFNYASQSDGVDHATGTSLPFYPIPAEAITNTGWIEEGPPGNIDRRSYSDRHMLIVDRTNNWLYELYNVFYNGTGWLAGSGAFYDMKTNNRRPEGWTSADAAGLAMLPGLVRYDEAFGAGEIGHAFRFTVRTTNGHVYPASHTAGSTAGALPMGARLRLKASTNISGFTPEVRRIFRAMMKYGLIVADNGSDMYVSGTYDTRWDNGVLNPAFGSVKASDFEVVQLGWTPPVNFVISVPSSFGAGDPAAITITAYDSSYNLATGYRGTIAFASSDLAATLPSNYTFTGTDNGAHTFNGIVMRTAGAQTISATDVADATITATRNVVVGPPAPTGLAANMVTTTRVDLAWTASATAVGYEIARTTAGVPYATIATVGATTSYSDITALASAANVYKVRAIDASSNPSPYSTPDAATTMFFTDDPLAAGTIVKAVHLTEVRAAVNLMRDAAGLAQAVFTDITPSGVAIKAVHLLELRTALSAARTALGLSAITFTDPGLTTGTTVRAVHVQEIRDGVK